MKLHPTVEAVTRRIRERSASTRAAYLQKIDAAARQVRGADRMGCANVAHAFAGVPSSDKFRIVAEKAPNIGIVTAYNDNSLQYIPTASAFPEGAYEVDGGWRYIAPGAGEALAAGDVANLGDPGGLANPAILDELLKSPASALRASS